MRARQLILAFIATAAAALPAAAQSVYYGYPRYHSPPPYYAPPVYAPPPAYAYPPRYYAPPPARYYAPPAYVPYGPPPVEYDYPHRSQPHSPDRPLSDARPTMPDYQGSVVVAIQQELAARGYDPGPATGQVDARTDDAIRRYQQDSGLPVTGQPTPALLDHLRAVASAPGMAPTAYPPPSYMPPPGSAVRNDATVAWVQDALNRRGYNVGPPDGILGQRTRAAIERFKRDSGMPVDSLINELLIQRLRA